jgi:hypothetical protein
MTVAIPSALEAVEAQEREGAARLEEFEIYIKEFEVEQRLLFCSDPPPPLAAEAKRNPCGF